MKLNTSLFICLFFSTIISIKAIDFDKEEYDYPSTENVENEMPIEEDEQEVETQEPETAPFQYKPSKRVEEMENNMPDSAKVFIGVGKLKDTMTDTYASAMATDTAKAGLADADHEWQLLLEGPEAARVIGTSGQNFNTIFSSNDGADMINMLATTMHVLLTKAGEQKMSSGLRDIMSMTYSLFTSPNMPEIVNKAGGLVITIVNKPGAPMFTKTYWNETKKLLSDKNLNEKLKKYFANIISMMKSLSGMMKGGKQLLNRRKRAIA
ncbi:uncharacterized protein LOC132936874 [Metopolophium dirhodum]|uniref:uncharacterized protein LOC132936874 n=1 Tax=Metopolophium dirhodum TaxID=44670 RepID=UPI00298FDE51|nr:uncharacterized protein LOC132936874 [Metopolophium dirhodum]